MEFVFLKTTRARNMPSCLICLETCTEAAELPCCWVPDADMQICVACVPSVFSASHPTKCPKCRAFLERCGDRLTISEPKPEPKLVDMDTERQRFSEFMDQTVEQLEHLLRETPSSVLPSGARVYRLSTPVAFRFLDVSPPVVFRFEDIN